MLLGRCWGAPRAGTGCPATNPSFATLIRPCMNTSCSAVKFIVNRVYVLLLDLSCLGKCSSGCGGLCQSGSISRQVGSTSDVGQAVGKVGWGGGLSFQLAYFQITLWVWLLSQVVPVV